jgi:predicted dehydrogenase
MRLFAVLLLWDFAVPAADLRLGIIGTDTSHVIAFTRVFNDPSNKDHVPGVRVVAAYKGGSPDVESSRSRVEGFAKELQEKWNVEIVPEIPALCAKVDGILLESVDGRTHLPQARQVIAARKPMFIDKPLAATYEDVREIARLARAAGVPWFSSSSFRWSEIAATLGASGAKAVSVWGPGPFEEHHYLELSWYAIHPIEALFAAMGRGCEEVVRTSGASADTITGRWKDGRTGTVIALRPYGPYGGVAYREKDVIISSPKTGSNYVPMLREVVKFFRNGASPVPPEETLEIFAFMDAAQKSKEQGGKPVKLRALE